MIDKLKSLWQKILPDQERSIQKEKDNRYKKIVFWIWGLAGMGVLGLIGFFYILSTTDLPTFEELENPQSNLSSNIYANDLSILGRWFTENRIAIEYEDLNEHIVNALLATEDERFHRHPGIDVRGTMRAVVFLGSRGGGSTITQQLSKLLYTNKPADSFIRRVFQKFKEYITSVKLERAYTKEEIMAMYLNKYDFNNDSHGIEAAANTYFGKNQSDLSLSESAVLVGMLQNSSLFRPRVGRKNEHTKRRRNIVLSQCMKAGHITRAEYDSLKVIDVDVTNFKRADSSIGPAPYFTMELRKPLDEILSREECRKPDGSKYNKYRDGLRIYTTIDPLMQAHLQDAILEHMPVLQEKYWKVWKNLDPWTYKENVGMEDETPDAVIEIRINALKNLMRGSERYQNLKSRIVGPSLGELQAAFEDFNIQDYVLDRLYREDNGGGVLTILLGQDLISSSLAKKYREVLKHEQWPIVKDNYETLLRTAEKDFKSPTPMKVFDYNPEFQKDTIMTPLDSIKYHRMILQIGSLAVDPTNGHVKAWVGGVNHKYFKYDHIKSNRLVGSTIKPFVYTAAISQQGLSPCYGVYDTRYTIHKDEPPFYLDEDWSPQNIGESTKDSLYTLFDGLKYSVNTISVALIKQLASTQPVRELMRNIGIDVDGLLYNGMRKVQSVPSICLGAANLSVYDMTGAYTAFANNGIYNKPVFISRIEDKNGRVIYKEISREQQGINPVTNWVMTEMLKYNVQYSLNFNHIKVAKGGKTGTTNDYTDGWFMGITPNLVLGTWVGGEDPWIRFKSTFNGTGSKMARPVFVNFLKKVEADSTLNFDIKAQFNIPAGASLITMNCKEYDYSNVKLKLDAGTDDPFGDDPFDDPFDDEDEFEDPFDDSFEEEPDTVGIRQLRHF